MSGEKDVKGDAKAILKLASAWFFMPVPTGYGRRGIPDFIACVPRIITPEMVGQRVGLFAGVEAKAAAHFEPSAWQQRELTAIDVAGGMTAVIGAPTHEAVLKQLLGLV